MENIRILLIIRYSLKENHFYQTGCPILKFIKKAITDSPLGTKLMGAAFQVILPFYQNIIHNSPKYVPFAYFLTLANLVQP